jgi:chromosome segregation ATPase
MQAVTLQQAASESQQDGLTLRGQLASLQQNVHLLGGNLQGRLSMVQGAVLSQMQQQLADKDAAVAASKGQLGAIQVQLERLSAGFAAKLAAEQAERQRLGAEAAQARLLCMARGRQLGQLQEQLAAAQAAASQQQAGTAAAAGLQQQQLESLQGRLQEAQQQLEAAQRAAVDAAQQAAAAEGGKAGLRQQVEELSAALAERQLQIEWLEGKVADLEDGDVNQQVSSGRGCRCICVASWHLQRGLLCMLDRQGREFFCRHTRCA